MYLYYITLFLHCFKNIPFHIICSLYTTRQHLIKVIVVIILSCKIYSFRNMNMSQEIMNMSFASSQNSHVYGLHQNIQREYHNISPDRKHVLINNKRHVRIRNPRYVTPGVARPHKSPVRHHNRNLLHMPTTLLEPCLLYTSPSPRD